LSKAEEGGMEIKKAKQISRIKRNGSQGITESSEGM
jgi:hypothetical protein